MARNFSKTRAGSSAWARAFLTFIRLSPNASARNPRAFYSIAAARAKSKRRILSDGSQKNAEGIPPDVPGDALDAGTERRSARVPARTEARFRRNVPAVSAHAADDG